MASGKGRRAPRVRIRARATTLRARGRRVTPSIAGISVVAGTPLVASASKASNRRLVIKALTDPGFRKQLVATPEKALGVSRLSDENRVQIKSVLSSVKAIEYNIRFTADSLLCANTGCCGIA